MRRSGVRIPSAPFSFLDNASVRVFASNFSNAKAPKRNSTHKLRNRFSVDVRQPVAASLILEREALVIDSQQAKQCRLKVVNMHRILHNAVAVLVGRTI